MRHQQVEAVEQSTAPGERCSQASAKSRARRRASPTAASPGSSGHGRSKIAHTSALTDGLIGLGDLGDDIPGAVHQAALPAGWGKILSVACEPYHDPMADDDPLDNVVAGYDLLASRWDRWVGAVEPPLRERYVDWLEAQLGEESRVLELGCGTGRPVADRLATRYDYLGVDVSPVMVATATRNVPSGRFMAADMRRLEFPAEVFDAVVAFYSIIHIPRADQPALFSSIRRWLRPRGHLIASLISGDLPAGREDNWLEAGPMFWSGYDADTNQRLLIEAGFRLI